MNGWNCCAPFCLIGAAKLLKGYEGQKNQNYLWMHWKFHTNVIYGSHSPSLNYTVVKLQLVMMD